MLRSGGAGSCSSPDSHTRSASGRGGFPRGCYSSILAIKRDLGPMKKQLTFGVIVGSRGFFPHHLAKEGREEMIRVLDADGYKVVVLSPEQTQHGAVQTPDDARHCAELFKKHREEIDGIIVTLPNFGEERAIGDAIRLSTLKVPVLVQATPDRAETMKIANRRDSFCGKMSACNNLMQYGIPYSLTALHTEAPAAARCKPDLEGCW